MGHLLVLALTLVFFQLVDMALLTLIGHFGHQTQVKLLITFGPVFMA
jgi:hypothetical protein